MDVQFLSRVLDSNDGTWELFRESIVSGSKASQSARFSDALMTFLEYGDYKCPCLQCEIYPIVKAVQRSLGNRRSGRSRDIAIRPARTRGGTEAPHAARYLVCWPKWLVHATKWIPESKQNRHLRIGYFGSSSGGASTGFGCDPLEQLKEASSILRSMARNCMASFIWLKLIPLKKTSGP
jgi:hypothetical protein